jgi:hypothetical protein
MIKKRFPVVSGLLGELFAWALIILPLFCSIARAQQDIIVVGGTNPYIILGRGLAWGGSGTANLNNNFIFSPVDPNQGFCLFLSNNNATSAHSVSIIVSQTGDPALHSYTGITQKWFPVSTTTIFPLSVPASGIVGVNYKTTASAGITVSFSGATTQAGSPDTVDVFAVQTNQSACGSLPNQSVQGPFQNGTQATNAQQFPVLIGGLLSPGTTSTVGGMAIGSNSGLLIDSGLCCTMLGGGFINVSSAPVVMPNGRSSLGELPAVTQMLPVTTFGVKTGGPALLGGYTKTSILEMATDQASLGAGSMPAWVENQKATNPAAGQFIVGDYLTTSAAINLAWKWATVSCSAACEFQISNISSGGATCTAVTAHNLQLWGNTAEAFNVNHVAIGGSTACGTQPTVAGAPLFDISLAAGTSYTVDLSGFVDFHQGTSIAGIGVFNVSALTGTMSASISVVEQ